LAERWQRLDILVNAAAIEIEKTIEDTTLEEWNHIFAINVTGMFLTSKYALPLIRKSEAASIINFGSYDGYIADPGLAAYCATKGAVHALRHPDAAKFFWRVWRHRIAQAGGTRRTPYAALRYA
jgi:meso-butanediol dehydrogenase/(S,S)-butanediol dehydrogenase/diacetyl reductase